MDRSEFDIIRDLMDELQDTMTYRKEDFEERLGRKKPMMDEGMMKKTSEHYGVNKDPGKLPEDEDIGEDERLMGRLMRLRA